MNDLPKRKRQPTRSWAEDLEASRDVGGAEKKRFAFLLGWFEKWRLGKGLAPGREAARAFWRDQVGAKPREAWQLDGWAEAVNVASASCRSSKPNRRSRTPSRSPMRFGASDRRCGWRGRRLKPALANWTPTSANGAR
ncbi:MAG: hypothetical protein R3F11_01785 [Verrucomicrobiales bacterium]